MIASVGDRRLVYLYRGQMKSTEFGTFGLWDSGTYKCMTLERPPAGDHPCIPAGEYDVDPTTCHLHHNPCYEIMNVPARTAILIHSVNWFEDLLGCVAPGQAIEVIEGLLATTGAKVKHLGVSGSKKALAALIADLDFKPFRLIVKEPTSL